ncbi:ABC transporter permease [Marinovum sp. 2_MG-2023]|uniref:ABC transporter permease n=1 Tax=unclassified Marinovum TaxID=2647166 RepID=UPI0026E21341|nr:MULTISPECIES: ABC transporter permease [unclassified Marinovum]MDO6730014.1 ABC transporter permease [Marinovum sp. 2_MG-2023]MDO6779828.1 ABC transporter permease [Marinovum sp. 1_MG-2023]
MELQHTATLSDPRAADDVAEASQARLIWEKFRKHRVALVSLYIVGAFYVVALFAEFFQPFDPNLTSRTDVYHPPQMIRLTYVDDMGKRVFAPHVQKQKLKRDKLTLKASYAPVENERVFLRLFPKVETYKLVNLIPVNRTLFGPVNQGERFYLFGSDRLGRDMFSRIVAGTRISMSIGLVGVGMSLVLGLIIGGAAGYFGGWFDTASSRVIELMLSIPTIPIWLGLSAALPPSLDPLTRYFMITLILSLIGWTELARVVRGRFMAMRSEDFVTAARLDGASPRRVIFRHMMPSLVSHIIASVSLAIPVMILAETSLSFLGLGLMPPSISWGVLLKEAQNIRSIAQAEWLFIPGGFVVVVVLALNFLGDGLRDAADPYSQHGA